MIFEKTVEKIRTFRAIDAFIITMVIFFVIFLMMFIYTDGLILKISLHQDNNDAFMDYFNSMYQSTKRPYTEWNVIYPPLITVYYSLLGTIVKSSMSGEYYYAQDIRTTQIGMMLYILPVIITLLILQFVIQRQLFQHSDKKKIAIIFFIMVSVPIIYGVERGNAIIFALLFLVLFLLGYDSDNKKIRYISYTALGISAGIKIFPLIFGILVLKRKDAVDTSACILIVSAILIIPFIFTDGDLSILSHSIISATTRYSDDEVLYISISNCLSNIISGRGQIDQLIISLSPYVYTLICMAIAYFNKTMPRWQVIFLLSSIMIIGPGTSTRYAYCYLIIPLLFLLNEKGIVPLIITTCIAFVISFMPVTNLDALDTIVNIKGILTIIICLVLCTYGIIKTVRNNIPNMSEEVG